MTLVSPIEVIDRRGRQLKNIFHATFKGSQIVEGKEVLIKIKSELYGINWLVSSDIYRYFRRTTEK